VLNAVAPKVANLIGGSADLAPSTKTLLNGEADYQANDYTGRNLRFGVREHAMGGILNGMALHQGLIPYGATFLVFSDYMRPAIRLAALTELKVIYVFTHDSIGLGEDGPTHQPIEHLAALRAMPNLTVIRPCDANETAEAWRAAIRHRNGPVALALSRQNLATLDRKSKYTAAEGLHQGAYILSEAADHKPDVVLIASGSEVHIALEAAATLRAEGPAVRVVSMPSWELFEAQPEAYRQRVLPPEIKAKIAIEAGSAQGWHRYVGEFGQIIALDHFGASAPSGVLFEKFGLTADRVVEKALEFV
jgi:transketolase